MHGMGYDAKYNANKCVVDSITLCSTDDSFGSNDVEQLISFFMHQLMTLPHYLYFSFFPSSELHFECELILGLHVTCRPTIVQVTNQVYSIVYEKYLSS